MANNQLAKEEIEALLATPGKVRGVVFQTDAEYVRSKKGEEGVLAVEEELKKLGCPLDYRNIKAISWYPIGLRVISLLVIKNILGLEDKDIEEMGNLAPKYSLIVKLLMKYFLSPKTTLRESPKYWMKHYDFGMLEVHEYNEKEKRMSVRIKEYKTHPIVCIFHKGYFLRMAQYVIKSQKIGIEETKCVYRGDPYHEYTVTWK